MENVVSGVVYLYLAICAALLVFNVAYIARTRHMEHRRARRAQRWRRRLEALGPRTGLRKRAIMRLRHIEQLMAFENALESLGPTVRETVEHALFVDNRRTVREVALAYGKREPMERAFFAYVVATFHPPIGEARDPLVEILLGYLDGSTVYCRENVLGALYRLGNLQAIEHAFDQLNEEGWYHQPHLLSDGLLTCTGNREQLVKRLWSKRHVWEECLVVATVQLATGLPEPIFASAFAHALAHEELPLEVRFALVRHLRRHPTPEAHGELVRLIRGSDPEEQELAVAAASALAAYPSPETKATLLNAFRSHSWHVRRNAADTLRLLGVDADDMHAVEKTGDRYAIEMLSYTLAPKGGRP